LNRAITRQDPSAGAKIVVQALRAEVCLQWLTGPVFGGPTAQAFHDRVHAAGRLLLLTGDLAAYSSARRAGSPATFKQLFPGGCWAAWVPLSVHLYDDGAGTRPD